MTKQCVKRALMFGRLKEIYEDVNNKKITDEDFEDVLEDKVREED